MEKVEKAGFPKGDQTKRHQKKQIVNEKTSQLARHGVPSGLKLRLRPPWGENIFFFPDVCRVAVMFHSYWTSFRMCAIFEVCVLAEGAQSAKYQELLYNTVL